MKINGNVHGIARPQTFLPPEIAGKLFYVLPDWLTPYYNYQPRMKADGTPAVLRYLDSENETMECWYQKDLWYPSLCYFAPGRSESGNVQAWKDLTSSIKAFTNEWGTDKGYDCVTGNNAGKELAKQAHVSCGGNVFIGIPGKTKNFGSGKVGQAVLVLDRDHPITWDALRQTKFWKYFVHTATVITKFPATDYHLSPSTVVIPDDIEITPTKQDPFPHNQNYPTKITPVPQASYAGERWDGLVSHGIHCRVKYVMVERLVALPDDESQISPFIR